MTDSTLMPADYLVGQLSKVAKDVFFAFDLTSGKFLHLNPAFEKVCNLSCEAVKANAQLFFDIIHKDDRLLVIESLANFRDTKQKHNFEFRIGRNLHPKKWIRTNVYLYQDGVSEIIIGTATDITSEKAYQKTIYGFFEQKNTLLDIMSRDLSSPLSTINMSAQVLVEHIKNTNDEAILRLLEIITETSRNGITLIQNLFAKELIEISNLGMIKQRVDIVEYLSNLVHNYQNSKHLLKQKFHFITSVRSLFVTVDIMKFLHAVAKLFTNALTFTPDSGNITVAVEEKSDSLLIKVQDDGFGIPAETQPSIFHKSTEEKRPGSQNESTSGLGLYTVKNIIEWHNGNIWFESKHREGTTFFIEIPKD